MKEQIVKIIEEQVKSKVSELSDWKQVQYQGGRLYYESTRILNEINDYDLEFQVTYLEKLLESDFVINDNWPSEAPDITLDFKNWLVKRISGLKIKLIQNQKSKLPENIEEPTLAELGLEKIITETLESWNQGLKKF